MPKTRRRHRVARGSKPDTPNGTPRDELGGRELLFMIEGGALLDMSDDELDRFLNQVWDEFERTAQNGQRRRAGRRVKKP
jgi:hypothetical protein